MNIMNYSVLCAVARYIINVSLFISAAENNNINTQNVKDVCGRQ